MKKAKLDLWEDIPEPELQAVLPVQMDDSSEDAAQEGFFRKWARNKLFILIMPAAVVLLLIVSVTTFLAIRAINQKQVAKTQIQRPQEADKDQRTQKSASVAEEIVRESEPAVSVRTETLHFTDFIIDLKDAAGNSHVLICDVALEITDTGKGDRIQKITLIRGAIIKATQARSVVALRSVEERKKLKKDFAAALERILGDGSVKDVYFTNYLII